MHRRPAEGGPGRPCRYRISPGTLDPTLHRLEVDGRARRVYWATEAGKKALAEDRRALREPAREVPGDEVP
ncbi:PadR family transcriptional regulator [Streptomyces sp. NPDC002125]